MDGDGVSMRFGRDRGASRPWRCSWRCGGQWCVSGLRLLATADHAGALELRQLLAV